MTDLFSVLLITGTLIIELILFVYGIRNFPMFEENAWMGRVLLYFFTPTFVLTLAIVLLRRISKTIILLILGATGATAFLFISVTQILNGTLDSSSHIMNVCIVDKKTCWRTSKGTTYELRHKQCNNLSFPTTIMVNYPCFKDAIENKEFTIETGKGYFNLPWISNCSKI